MKANDDRERLELAAKAVGIPVTHPVTDDGVWNGLVSEYWNPLTDDGDRYRLAIQLRLFGSEQLANWVSNYILEGYSYDEAYKWGIVRAAAEIGRSMK